MIPRGKLLSKSRGSKKNRFRCEMEVEHAKRHDRIDEKWKQIYETDTFFHFSFPFFSSLSSLLNSDVLTNERYLNIDKKRKTARGGSDLSCQDGGGREERIVRMHQVEYACTFISV